MNLNKYKDMKVVFMGTPEFAVPILELLIKNFNVVLVVTQPDKEVGREKKLTFSPVKKLAISNDIEVFQPFKIREDYERILSVKPDIIITCAYGQIIPKVLLDAPKYKCINVHASLLPKLRGGAPIHHAIIDGYDKTGITIMFMNEKMDEGNIISQKEIEIMDDDNVGILHDKLSELGKNLLLETLPDIFEGTYKSIPQDNDEATYAYNIKKEDEFINFNLNAKEVNNKVRGLYPFPGSYAILDNERIKIIECEIGGQYIGKPGEIINLYKNGIGIMCADKEIIIKKLKPEGKNIMNAEDFINGRKNLKGKIFNEF
jgi:methionyl-tRNA formyltransferase